MFNYQIAYMKSSSHFHNNSMYDVIYKKLKDYINYRVQDFIGLFLYHLLIDIT